MTTNFLKYPTIALLAVMAACTSDEPGNDTKPDATPSVTTRAIKVSVIDYSPAPGQFVNVIPEWEPGDNAVTMCRKATEALNDGSMITLGAFGGTVTLKLDEPIAPIAGKPEFQVLGNAISTSAEPGVVSVSPDNIDWYILKGEMGYDTRQIATITYSRPADNAGDETYIPWSLTSPAAEGTVTGYLYRVPLYHTQDYYPSWITDNSITLTAQLLPDNRTIDPDNGQYVLSPYKGYADSYPNNSADSYLDLDNAVNADGSAVADMRPINYIRITTGILQNNGPLGECSTEISGIARIIYE